MMERWVYIAVFRSVMGQYSYLSSFRQWATGALFLPLSDVKVTVDVQSNLQLCECTACTQVMQNSQLLNTDNCCCINSFDLKTIVSCVLCVIDYVYNSVHNNIHKGPLPSLSSDEPMRCPKGQLLKWAT